MKIFVAAAILSTVLASPVWSACSTYTAPGKFNNRPTVWNKTDSGPIVDGFIHPISRNGTMLKHVQGIDLSRYNKHISYSTLSECGGKFAFVQMDELFDDHLDGLMQANVTGMPYYFFSLPKELLKASALPISPTEQQIREARQKYGDAGRQAAAEFLEISDEYEKQRGSRMPADTTIGGLTRKFVGLDVEQQPIKPIDTEHARQYGRFYATAICVWIQAVKAKIPDIVPLLYTYPAIYGDYLRYAYTEEAECLDQYPVWISRTYPNGWEALTNQKKMSSVDKVVQRFCLSPRGNRCLIHQYTHRGIFMATKQSRPIPIHFDLDRFYDAKVVDTQLGQQFVRVEDPYQ
jgi:hypothetical protein